MTLPGAPPSRPDHGSVTARYRGGRQAVEYAILRVRRHKDKAQAETLLTRTTGGSGMSVTQRLAAGACRPKSTGPRTSSRRSRRSYAGTKAGAVAVQDADHPRHQPSGALPRLGDQGPALRCQDHAATSGGQRAVGLFVPRTVIRQRCALYMSKEIRHNAARCFTTIWMR